MFDPNLVQNDFFYQPGGSIKLVEELISHHMQPSAKELLSPLKAIIDFRFLQSTEAPKYKTKALITHHALMLNPLIF
jgi:hypothetical protein